MLIENGDLDSIVRVIQSSLTPIFLLTAVAGLLNCFTSRLARISDLLHAVAAEVPKDEAAERAVRRRLAYLRRRSYVLDLAVVLASIAGATTCATALTLFLALIRAKGTAPLLFVLFGIAIFCTIGALGAFLTEVLIASRGFRAEADTRIEQPRRS